jgi:hypothetical protein
MPPSLASLMGTSKLLPNPFQALPSFHFQASKPPIGLEAWKLPSKPLPGLSVGGLAALGNTSVFRQRERRSRG